MCIAHKCNHTEKCSDWLSASFFHFCGGGGCGGGGGAMWIGLASRIKGLAQGPNSSRPGGAQAQTPDLLISNLVSPPTTRNETQWWTDVYGDAFSDESLLLLLLFWRSQVMQDQCNEGVVALRIMVPVYCIHPPPQQGSKSIAGLVQSCCESWRAELYTVISKQIRTHRKLHLATPCD